MNEPAPLEVVLHREKAEYGLTRVGIRAVVRRRIVTEVRQVDVTVRREVIEVEHLPLVEKPGEPHRELPPPGGDSRPLTILLSEEVPVVQLETRPYERVTVSVETVTEQQEVASTLATERAEITTTAATPLDPGPAPRTDR